MKEKRSQLRVCYLSIKFKVLLDQQKERKLGSSISRKSRLENYHSSLFVHVWGYEEP